MMFDTSSYIAMNGILLAPLYILTLYNTVNVHLLASGTDTDVLPDGGTHE